MSDRTTDWNLDGAHTGSHVVVRDRYHASQIKTVASVNSRKVTLDDGSEWTRRGRKWGATTGRWMTGPRAYLVLDLKAVRAEVAEEQAEAKLEAARRTIGNRFDNITKHLSLAEIDAINAILDANKQRREAAQHEAGAEAVTGRSEP